MLSALRLPAARPGLARPSRERLVIAVPAAAARSGDGGDKQEPAPRRPNPRPPPPPAGEAQPSELGSSEQQHAADGQPKQGSGVPQGPSLHRPKPRAPPPSVSKARAGSPRRQQQPAAGQPGSGRAVSGGLLQEQLRSTRSPERVLQLVQQAGQLCDFADVTLAVNRLARLAEEDSSLAVRCRAAYQQLAQLALSLQLDPWAVAQFVWAAARLWDGMAAKQPFGEQQAAWQARMQAAFSDRRCKPQSVSNSLWGASKLGWPLQARLAAAAGAAVVRLAGRMDAQNVSNILVAYANVDWQLSSTAASALLGRLEQVLPQAAPQAVANSLWAAAKLGLRLSGSLEAALVEALWRIIPAANSQDLANSLLACGTLGWSPGHRVLAAAVAAMQQQVAADAVNGQALRNFLWGLAELQEQGTKLPDSLHPLLEAASGWAASRWGQLSALDVADLCYNLARSGHRPGSDWLGSATARCLECITASDVEGALFGNFVWACSTWGHRLQRSALEQLVPAAVDTICGDWAEGGRGGALQLAEALTRQGGFHVGSDHPAASAAIEGRLLPLACADIGLVTAGRLHPENGELPYLASWASHLATIGVRLPAQQLEALCGYVGQRLQQLRPGDRACLPQAFEAWSYQPGLALLASI